MATFTMGRRRGSQAARGIGGISSVRAPQIGSVPELGQPAIGRVPTIRGPYEGYSERAMRNAFQRDQAVQAPKFGAVRNVTTPSMQNVGDVQFNPYQASGISGVGNLAAPSVDMGAVPDVGWQPVDAQQTGVSGLQAALTQQAMQDVAMGGQLTAQEQREAQQAARQAYSDRGMGLSGAALAAEVLNRDAYSRQRLGERRQFAYGVEQLGQAQRLADMQAANQMALANAQGQLAADQTMYQGGLQAALANQQAGLTAGLANQQMDYNVGAFNAAAQNAAAAAAAQGGLQAGMANQATQRALAQTQYQGGLQANLANQQADLTRAQTQYQGGMQARLANQQAFQQMQAQRQQAAMANQALQGQYGLAQYQGGLQTGQATQAARMQALLANQQGGLQAQMANQRTALGRYGIDRGIAQQQWDWQRNADEARAIREQNMQDLMTASKFFGSAPAGFFA